MIGTAVVGIGLWQLYVRVVSPPGGGPVEIASRPDQPTPPPLPSGAATVAPADAQAAEPTVAPADARATHVATATSDAGATHVATATPDAGATHVATATPDAGAAPRDAGAAPRDAGAAAAQVATPTLSPTPGPGGDLTISSTPQGARVFLDGADAGVTPLHLPSSPDRHNLALLLAGHDLYLAQVVGHGTFQIPLKEVTPASGPAGIKVLKCKDKERYYVFVDGKPTGQTCPTERIECEMGPHTVEVYDVVSETRHKWDIVVKETRLSFRVRVE
jgi:hypothetical protein